MKLADASAARVDFEKLTDCLLSKSHPVGKSNAAFFGQLGLSHDRPEALLAALLEVARSESVVDRSLTPFGAEYVIDGRTKGPKPHAVRTVGFFERNAATPRLVTAYPAPREDA